MMKRFMSVCLFIFLNFGCVATPRSEIVGNYQYVAPETRETLELKANGEFVQKVELDGSVFTASGTWSYDNVSSLSFEGFLVRFDTTFGKTIEPPIKYSVYNG